MTTMLAPADNLRTIGDLIERLGDITPHRIRLFPTPGTATEQDVINIEHREKRLCELVEGVLVEKPMGFVESRLAILIATQLQNFVDSKNLGIITGEAGTILLMPGLVRIPDIAFISRERLPDGKLPREPIPLLAPDLVVEVLSGSNTKREMALKRREYFDVGVRLLWEVDPKSRTVAVYTDPNRAAVLDDSETLTGGDVLPGLSISLNELFAKLDS